jgi:HPt (histidine-containing phosphotransfer) domain-containing protein
MRLSDLTAADPQHPRTVLDDDHLARMTLGDVSLEREVLEIFARQVALLLPRITGGEPATAAAAAHTLKGSARGIGAWRVADAAERMEQEAGKGTGTFHTKSYRVSIAELDAATRETCTAIWARLRPCSDGVRHDH